jgi:hypothetical protein
MNVKADESAGEIAAIADVATIDATLIPTIISYLSQYSHSTRAAIISLASALSTVSQS